MARDSEVLLIDDDPQALMLLELILENEHDLVSARDGVEAWDMLVARESAPDLIICDLSMPRLSGAELIGRLREDPRFVTTPVILLTGHDSHEMRLDMLEAGVSDYLVKPFPPGELRLRVRNILRDSEMLRTIERAQQTAEEANRQLRQVNEELDLFAAKAAHDIQAPLANISGYAHLLRRGIVEDPEKIMALLGSIEENAKNAIVLVRDLLAHARTVATADEVDVIDLNPLLRRVLRHLESAIEEAGATVVIAPDIGSVSGQRVAVESLLLNLLSNALKYRHPDRACVVTISASPAQQAGQIEVRVRDNGRGIPTEERERVFELGVRSILDVPGTGIGLATARAVVARHGGSISLQDSPTPGGLEVRFTLPAA